MPVPRFLAPGWLAPAWLAPAWLALLAWTPAGLAVPADKPASVGGVAPALTQPIERALDAAQRTPGAFPAVSAAIVQGDAVPWIHARGVRRTGEGAANGVDAPSDVDGGMLFYIASQTKSFVGLLGAVLDRKGVLPLDTTLADVWPELRLPAPADPRRITMSDLLSHQEGLSTDTLNFVTAYVRDLPAADYPRWLASETTTRAPGFRYANLGDLVYGAALEARTGRNWRDWLDAEVLRPLRLDAGVASRPSQVAPGRVAWNHQWDGGAWHADAPKPDALMHAAGGLLASADAMATWMQANLGLGGAGAGLDPRDFARAQRPVAAAKLADGEIDCDGYSLGWYACTYKGQHALMHPGSYVGAVSMTVLVPSAHAGLSLAVNSDSAMEGFELEVMKAFIGLATGQAGEEARLDAAVAALPERVAGKARKRAQAIADARKDAAWGGWAWTPDARALRQCAGTYADPLFGTLVVRVVGTGLAAEAGARHLVLEPAKPGLFAASDGTLEPPEAFACGAAGDAVEWRGRTFRRIRPSAPGLPRPR
jgi:CubicO group peptidase (beta-lactamase class C family)